MEDRLVAITGLGVVSPAGCRIDAFWDGLCAAESPAAPIPHLVDRGLDVAFGCQVQGLDASVALTAKEARRMDPFARFAVAAAVDALADAGSPAVDPDRAAVVVGTGGGGQHTSETEGLNLLRDGPWCVNPLMVPMAMANAAVANVALKLGWRGPTLGISTACTSGAHAIGEALHMVRAGRADVALAGGAEAPMTPLAMAAFANLRALSRRSDDPRRASRPFDADRDGFVMGEGAAFVVLEPLDAALGRGARPYAVLAGYAANTDAHHLVMPAPDGATAAACMRAAIAGAGVRPADVSHVNAHGTSTELNDRAEARAIEAVFGDDAPCVTATKGAIGHLIGAAGAVELVATVLSVHHGLVPPTANLERPEPGLGIDVVTGTPRKVEPAPAISNSFGFGGHNACLVVTPV